jgi:hypothetical protein
MNKVQPVKVVEVIKDFKELRAEILELYNKYGNDSNQIILQTNKEGVEDWYSGIGRVEDLPEKIEDDYVHIQPSLKGSLIEKYILKYKGFRTRIMNLPPKVVYTVHADSTKRIHIPILSNKHSWMIWPHYDYCIQLKEGFSYETDTTLVHTAFNGSPMSHRMHIVMCVDNPLT